jgi:hypothetical protein
MKKSNNKQYFTIMKKANLFLAALAAIVFAACSDNFADAPPVVTPNPELRQTPIEFVSSSSNLTRADYTGAVAAEMLDKKFVVSGYKGSSSATPGSIVYDNFLVEWIENSANTTASNTDNWEYVGRTPILHARNNGITQQTIKYWDYTQPQYDFIAWSTGSKTAVFDKEPAAGEVLVSAITPSSATTAAYTFKGTAADLSQCYISDLVTVKKDGSTKSKYAEPVVMTFRSLGTKVRIGIYETIPGYSVKNVKFYPKAGVLDDASEVDTEAKIFTTTANDVYTKGTYTVYFPTVDTPTNTDNNQAHITFSGTGEQTTIVEYGEMNYTSREASEKTTDNVFLGRSSNAASFAGSSSTNYYTYYLPNENGTNFNLRVDFTLEAIDGTGEEIVVKNASAQIPLIYTQWKAGYAYTYLFKISDKTNGRTGKYDPTKPDDDPYNSDPDDLAGLYPITFDAVVVDAEDNEHTQETITTITTPSITSYQKASTVVNADEYTANGNDIYVTVNENDNLVTLTGTAALYSIPAGKTEAEIVDALSIPDDKAAENTLKGRNGIVLTNETFALTNKIEYGVDGNVINIGADQALSFTPVAGTTYAFVYTQSAPTSTTTKYQNVTTTAGDDVSAYCRDFNLVAASGDAKASSVYYSKDADGVLTRERPFTGQNVSSLFERTGAGTDDSPYVYTAASGRAVAGTAYFYTTDGGTTYKAAVNIAYADFAEATDLYTFDGADYTLKTDASPVSGTAYYQRTGAGTDDDPYVYTYCVILPQQVDGLYEYVYDGGRYPCFNDGEKALAGHNYYDKYFQNNGVYYTKVIKVQ